MIDKGVAILFVKMREDLGVRMSCKLMPALFEIGADLAIVVELAVHHDDDRTVAVEDGLVAGFEIDDRQTPHSKRGSVVDPNPFGIRPAMHDRLAHRVQHGFGAVSLIRFVQVEPTCDSAHSCNLQTFLVAISIENRMSILQLEQVPQVAV